MASLLVILGVAGPQAKEMNRIAVSVLLTLLLVSVSTNDISQPQFATTKLE